MKKGFGKDQVQVLIRRKLRNPYKKKKKNPANSDGFKKNRVTSYTLERARGRGNTIRTIKSEKRAKQRSTKKGGKVNTVNSVPGLAKVTKHYKLLFWLKIS